MVPFAAAFVCPSMPVLDPAAATILVVEDEPTVCELAAEALLDEGYRVLTAADAWEAEAILARESVDMLFTDIDLARNTNGLSLARLARRPLPGPRRWSTPPAAGPACRPARPCRARSSCRSPIGPASSWPSPATSCAPRSSTTPDPASKDIRHAAHPFRSRPRPRLAVAATPAEAACDVKGAQIEEAIAAKSDTARRCERPAGARPAHAARRRDRARHLQVPGRVRGAARGRASRSWPIPARPSSRAAIPTRTRPRACGGPEAQGRGRRHEGEVTARPARA